VVRLVVVGATGVLGPQLDLVELEVGRGAEAFCGVDQIGMEGEAVELPRRDGSEPEPGELVANQPGMRLGVRGVVVARRKDLEQPGPCRSELVGVQQALDDGESLRANPLERLVADAHVVPPLSSPAPLRARCGSARVTHPVAAQRR